MTKSEFDIIIKKTKQAVRLANWASSVCICGSSKYVDLIAVVKWEFEKQGIHANGLHALPSWYADHMKWDSSGSHGAEQEGVAEQLDSLHLVKIEQADCVLVVNPGDYVGERTTYEIDYARSKHKTVYFWDHDID